MKAVCILVCLALARHCAGSIFQHRRGSKMDRRVVQTPDYIDPYLQEQYQQYFAQYPYAQQVYQEQNQAPIYQERSERFRGGIRKPMYVSQDIERQLQQRQDRYPTERQEKHSSEKIALYGDSSSAETQSHKEETIQPLNMLTGFDDQYAAPRFADMGVARFAARNEKPALPGDATVWRGLKMATSPQWPVETKDLERIFSEAMKSMKHIQPETKTELHKAYEIAAQELSEDVNMNATELLKKYQYPVEEHTIKTDDGYYLTLFRISSVQSDPTKPRPVVFLMHGLLGSADDWLLMGPHKSLAYVLADAGYDVWLGNARSSRYTYHASKSRVQPDFWQFSNDEIAFHDLPAMIDYVLETSKVQKMFYVGHSSGTTAFFALASTMPEYNDKIVMMYALSPMVYMSGVRSPLVRMIAPNSRFYGRLHEQLGQGEFRPNEELVRTVGGVMCENEIGCKNICSNVYFVMSGVNVEDLEVRQIPSIMRHLPAGASTKQMLHFGQNVASLGFRMYDYGLEMNEKMYGQAQPPQYDMKKVSTPVVLFYSEHDWLAHPKDVARLLKELPSAMSHRIPEEYFTQNDFIVSQKATEQIYKPLIDSIKEHANTQEQQTSY